MSQTVDGYRSRITGGWRAGYFLTAFGITWGLAVVAAEHLLPFTVPGAVRSMAAILLYYGPALAAVLLVGLNGGKKSLAELARSLGRWRTGGFWWVFLFAFPVLVRLAAVGLDVALGGTFPKLMSAAGVPDGNLFLLIPVVFVLVFFQAGLAEEPGWRGYALPACRTGGGGDFERGAEPVLVRLALPPVESPQFEAHCPLVRPEHHPVHHSVDLDL